MLQRQAGSLLRNIVGTFTFVCSIWRLFVKLWSSMLVRAALRIWVCSTSFGILCISCCADVVSDPLFSHIEYILAAFWSWKSTPAMHSTLPSFADLKFSNLFLPCRARFNTGLNYQPFCLHHLQCEVLLLAWSVERGIFVVILHLLWTLRETFCHSVHSIKWIVNPWSRSTLEIGEHVR